MGRALSPTASPGAAVRTTGVWFGDSSRPALGWLTRLPDSLGASAVLVLPPVGYGYLCSHRTLRVLAERLASRGHVVLRIDYDGTGDSAGDQWDPGRIEAWRRTVREAAAYVRALGVDRVALAGMGLGATFALLEGRSLGAERIVAWDPVVSGRRHARELRMLSAEIPGPEDPLQPAGTRVWAGTVFSASTLGDLSRVALLESTSPPAPRVLVVDHTTDCAELLRSLGTEVDHLGGTDEQRVLDVPPEFATVPEPSVAAICRWVGDGAPRATSSEASAPGANPPSASPAASFQRWRGGEVVEEVMTIGKHGHVGIACSPPAPDPARATLVFLNPGSETHVGPGRAWVEYARDLALLGHRSVRVDFRGWGESPDAGRAPGRPYDACGVEDTVAIVRGLGAAGYERVVVLGLCASAWIALRAVLDAPVAGVIALNPQLYWNFGDPVDIDWPRIRARRADEIRTVERGHRLALWSVLDALGHRPRVARWLDDLGSLAVPVELLFAEGDDGIVYLRQRFGRRLARIQRGGVVRVTELPGIDHPMHMTWRRPVVVRAVHEALERVDGG